MHCIKAFLFFPAREPLQGQEERTGSLTQASVTLAFRQVTRCGRTSEGAFWLPLHSWIIPKKPTTPSNWSQSCYQANSWMTPGVGFLCRHFLFLPQHEGVQGCACADTLSSACSRSLQAGGSRWPVAVMWLIANMELTVILMRGGCVELE